MVKRHWTEGVCYRDNDFVYRLLVAWKHENNIRIGGQWQIYEGDGQKWANRTLKQSEVDSLRVARKDALEGAE